MANSSDKLLCVSHPTRFIAGAMSGTSADGVDVAIVRIDGVGLDMQAQLVRHHHQPYPSELRAEIFAFRGEEIHGPNVLSRLAAMGRAISLTYAQAVNDALLAAEMTAGQLSAVAAHGQTLFHDPPNTIQWFDPSLVAAEVGCPVVSDFRRADLAAGGQGAPLVPFADYILFRHPTKSRVLLNIGGIANVTIIPAECRIDQIRAFDTGPGNCISDYLCRKHDPGGPGYDVDGSLAMSGKADDTLVGQIHQHPFFLRTPPKSTDIPEMVAAFENAVERWRTSLRFEDLLATACELTAYSIWVGIFRGMSMLNMLSPPDQIIVSGGGISNRKIMASLRVMARGDSDTPGTAERLSEILTSDESGISSHAKEALAFALLGAATLDGVPSNVPSVTGAKRAVVLGSVTPKP